MNRALVSEDIRKEAQSRPAGKWGDTTPMNIERTPGCKL